MLNITKRFPGIIANDNITLQLQKGRDPCPAGRKRRGQVHADERAVRPVPAGGGRDQKGRPGRVQIKDPNDANALGIGMVHQHFKLVECFTVLDNIIMGVEPTKHGFLQKKEAREKVMALQREVRSARGPGRADRGHHRGHAAAHRDPEDAVPRKRDPDLRRAHRRADPAGDRRADADHAESGGRGQVHPVHLPQAQRDHGGGRPLHRAAQGQVHRHRGDRKTPPWRSCPP